MSKPLCGPEAMDAKYREISDMFIDAICETKALASTLDKLELRTRGEKAHSQIDEIYDHVAEAQTVLSEILANHLIDQRNRLSL